MRLASVKGAIDSAKRMLVPRIQNRPEVFAMADSPLRRGAR